MRIALVNKLARGGAFAACNRTRQALLEQGADVSLLTGEPYCDKLGRAMNVSEKVTPIPFVRRRLVDWHLWRHLGVSKSSFLKSRPRTLEAFHFPVSYLNLDACFSDNQFDIVNLHWVSGLLDYSRFFSTNVTPVVWTLHDMNPFSGGAHFEDQFLSIDDNGVIHRRIKTVFESEVELRISNWKKNSLSRCEPIGVISPSHWLMDLAKESGVLGHGKSKVIPYGVDTRVFSERSKKSAREFLGLNVEKPTFVFIADSVLSVRKGVKLFFKALASMNASTACQVCIVGGQVDDQMIGKHSIRSFGRITDEYILSLIYGAGDATVIASLEDNFPNTMLESIACGRPVLAFPVGGIPEAIETGKNGIIGEDISLAHLVAVLDTFIKNRNEFDPEKIREDAVNRFSLKRNAESYLDFFNDVFGG